MFKAVKWLKRTLNLVAQFQLVCFNVFKLRRWFLCCTGGCLQTCRCSSCPGCTVDCCKFTEWLKAWAASVHIGTFTERTSLSRKSAVNQYDTVQLYCPHGEILLAAIWTWRNIKHHINMVYLRFKKKKKKTHSRRALQDWNTIDFLSLGCSIHMPTHICNTLTHPHTTIPTPKKHNHQLNP